MRLLMFSTLIRNTTQSTDQPATQSTDQPPVQSTRPTNEQTELSTSMKKLTELSETINVLLAVQRRSDYAIAYVLNLIKKHHKDDVKELGFKNVEEYAEHHFGFAKSTYHTYTKVADRFVKPVVEMRKCLTTSIEITDITTVVAETAFDVLTDIDGYEFTISQMLELLPLTEDELHEHIEEFTSTDTTKSIREKVKAIRASIETTATEYTDEQADEQADDHTDEHTDEKTTEQSEPMTDNKRILAILNIANDLENAGFKSALIEMLNGFIMTNM